MKNSILLLLIFVASSVFAQKREVRQVPTFTKVTFRVPGKLLLKQGDVQKVELEGDPDVLEEIETDVDGDRLSIGKENQWMNWHWRDGQKINVYITMKNIEGLSVSGSGDLIGQGIFTTSDLDLRVSGSGTLQIEANASGDMETNVSGSGDLFFKGKCNNLESRISGSGKIVLTSTIGGTADVGISGSGKLEAAGTANQIKASVSGSGKVLAQNLEVKSCDVRISGSGDVEINVKEALDATISGSGSVTYKGSPTQVNSHSSGSGKVRKF